MKKAKVIVEMEKARAIVDSVKIEKEKNVFIAITANDPVAKLERFVESWKEKIKAL